MYNLGNVEKKKKMNDWKTTMPNLFRQFATWLMVRKNEQTSNLTKWKLHSTKLRMA